MKNLHLTRLIADVSLFFELCSDDVLDPHIANEVMERLLYELKLVDKAVLRDIVDGFKTISFEYGGEAADFVRDIPYAFLLEEALAADDPAKLAELEAQRDAREC